MVRNILISIFLSIGLVSGCSSNDQYIPASGEKVIVTMNAPVAIDKKTLKEATNYIKQNNMDALNQLSEKGRYKPLDMGTLVSVKDVHGNDSLIEVMTNDGFEGFMPLNVIEETLSEGEYYYLKEGSYFHPGDYSPMIKVLEARKTNEEEKIKEMYKNGELAKLSDGDLKVKLLKINDDGTILIEHRIDDERYEIYTELNSLSEKNENKGKSTIEYNSLEE